jgi:DNA-binding MarR family transcriptional regulator
MPDKSLSLGPIDAIVGFHLRRASFVFSPDFRKQKDVPRGMFGILSVVSANPGINQSSLGKTLGIDAANLVPLIDALVEKGLLMRTVHLQDRRSRSLNLTPVGHTRLEKIVDGVKVLEARMLADFSKDERKVLLTLLRRLHSQRGRLAAASARAIRQGVNERR